MANQTHTRRSPAKAISGSARAFLSIGGRIMIDPRGRLFSTIDLKLLLERTWPNPEPAAPFEHRRHIAKLYDQVEQNNEPTVLELVRKNGPVNGWLVWEKAA